MNKVQNNMYNTTSLFLEFVMGRFVDRAGQVFGRLTVTARAGTDANKKVIWACLCQCGKEVLIPSGSLVTGNTTSCGCYLKERVTKHGGWKNASYNSWRAMIRRCTVITDKDYPRYGGRGVSVCPTWMDYKTFVADMGEPTGAETLDRIDGYGNYNKTNCRWATPTIQARNIRVPKSSESGVTGVIKTYYGKWMASITANKKRYYAPVRDTVEESAQDRKELERLHWGVT
jgi:NAD(P)-dependent dehydrogenase (short-subunit alcohol dehydrogenase family)